MNKILLTVAIIIALSISPFTYASEICQPPPPDRYVKDSYIVDFIANPVDPVIWPAKRDPNSLNPVPFGENSSGQSKEELAKTLGINGQVIYIFDAINAAEIHMDAEEAYKLSLDPRVVRVTQEQIIEMPEMAFKAKAPACHPVYEGGLLTVPTIDTADQLGKFQDVVLKPTADGTWQLLKGNASGGGPTYAPITEVKVITTRSFPAQVFLKVSGSFSDGCWRLGKALHRFNGKGIEVSLYADYLYANYDKEVGGACTMGLLQFSQTIPLPVYGLKAGTYSYSVNANAFSGTFKLARDNKLAGD